MSLVLALLLGGLNPLPAHAAPSTAVAATSDLAVMGVARMVSSLGDQGWLRLLAYRLPDGARLLLSLCVPAFPDCGPIEEASPSTFEVRVRDETDEYVVLVADVPALGAVDLTFPSVQLFCEPAGSVSKETGTAWQTVPTGCTPFLVGEGSYFAESAIQGSVGGWTTGGSYAHWGKEAAFAWVAA